MSKICLVEDERSLIELIQLNLELEGHEIFTFSNGKIASEHFKKELNYDLIILDVMLPVVSGLDLCRQIRETSSIPILFLSAKGTTYDRIEGLKIGANDYLPKPFDLEELLLKVKILTIGTKSKNDITIIEIGNFIVDCSSYEVKLNEKIVHTFTKREISLIRLFKEKEGQVISRDEILDKIWGKDQFPTTRTIDNYVLAFRKLFEGDSKSPTHFFSIRGVGYKFLS
ncbi:MAG: response regulator transcription factor [Bacteroidetes bacterium]|nr:response regulator transcription factor [Bacteroidota bacterium]